MIQQSALARWSTARTIVESDPQPLFGSAVPEIFYPPFVSTPCRFLSYWPEPRSPSFATLNS